MIDQEIKKAIENGESVWCCLCENLLEFRSDNIAIFEGKVVGKTEIQKVGLEFLTNNSKLFYIPFRELYKTQAEAEHYLHHANVTRTDHLPFLTWEEFEERKSLYFTDKQGKEYGLTRDVRWSNDENRTEYCLKINNMTDFRIVKSYDYTEANFYKAYDECVRLFKKGE